jgi:hypothetical protein
MVAWLFAVALVIALFVVGPFAGFNRATPLILGMPPLYFWFVLASLLEPFIIGALYLYERAHGVTAQKE